MYVCMYVRTMYVRTRTYVHTYVRTYAHTYVCFNGHFPGEPGLASVY